MKSKQGLRILNVFVVILLVLGIAMAGTTPVTAANATGIAKATAMPSDPTPPNGSQITVDIIIDVSGVTSPDNYLGSFDATLDWNPTILSYNTNGGFLAGFAGAINTSSVASGHISFDGANASGVTGSIVVLNITFNVIAVGSSTLDLAFSAMSAASTFADIMPILIVLDHSVITQPAMSYIGDIGTGAALHDTEASPQPNLLITVGAAGVAAGDAIVVAFATQPSQDQIITVSDTAGNTYQQVAFAVGGGV